MRKYYELLSVEKDVKPMDLRDATREVIRKSYDFYNRDALKEVCEAYIILSDNTEKEKYDATTDEEYAFPNADVLQFRVEKLCDSIRDQVKNLANKYEEEMSECKKNFLIKLFVFIANFFITLFMLKSNMGFIYLAFPLAALWGIIDSMVNLANYYDLKKGHHTYFSKTLWECIELPH